MKYLRIALLLFVTLSVSCSPKAEPNEKPNILLIVTDDQGYADLSAFDHVSENCRTPGMDRIADNKM